MSRATALIRRLDVAMKRFAPPSRQVYKRLTTRTGGDDLIGRPGSTVKTDTLLSPQPLYGRANAPRGVGDTDSEIFVSGTTVRTGGQYTLTLSPTAITLAELQNEELQFVMKDSAGVEEVFCIEDVAPVGMASEDVMYLVVVRSIKR